MNDFKVENFSLFFNVLIKKIACSLLIMFPFPPPKKYWSIWCGLSWFDKCTIGFGDIGQFYWPVRLHGLNTHVYTSVAGMIDTLCWVNTHYKWVDVVLMCSYHPCSIPVLTHLHRIFTDIDHIYLKYRFTMEHIPVIHLQSFCIGAHYSFVVDFLLVLCLHQVKFYIVSDLLHCSSVFSR